MDRTHEDCRSRAALSAADEHEVADYLDGFIAALLAERRGDEAAPGMNAGKEERPKGEPTAPETPGGKEGQRPVPTSSASSRRRAPASMREELSQLFAGARDRAPSKPRPPLQRLIPAERDLALHSSGLETVDDRLGGGFGPGLHLVAGRTGSGKTAFIESAAWDAAASERPVLYYALKEGAAATRDRLTVTLAAIMGFSTITLGALQSQTLGVGDHARLRSLERVLETCVLRRISLIDAVHGGVDAFAGFVQDILVRSQEALELHEMAPLVLIDDAEHLMRALRVRPLADLLERLDDVLSRSRTTGLVTLTTPKRPVQGIEGLPAHTALALCPVPGSPLDFVEYVDLKVLTNARGAWTGCIPLLLDRRSGVFDSRAEAFETPRSVL